MRMQQTIPLRQASSYSILPRLLATAQKPASWLRNALGKRILPRSNTPLGSGRRAPVEQREIRPFHPRCRLTAAQLRFLRGLVPSRSGVVAVLRFAEGYLRLRKQLLQRRRGAARKSGNAKAGADLHFPVLPFEFFAREASPQLFQNDSYVPRFHMADGQHKFISSPSAAEICRAGIRFQHVREFPQHSVTRCAAVLVIHFLELIQVRKHEPEFKFVPSGAS